MSRSIPAAPRSPAERRGTEADRYWLEKVGGQEVARPCLLILATIMMASLAL